ncbi:glutathione peroxidase [Dyadobacter helix]
MITSLIGFLFADKSATLTRPADTVAVKQTLYDFKVKSLVGSKTVDLSKYKGKKVVVMNVASKCGFTKQYADWEKFYKDHGDKVVVLGFPSNDFKGQEPGSSEEIATFCSKTYGVTFPMFEKVEVIGDNKAPLYKWLTTKDLNGWNDQVPSWNFCKYVVNEKGELTHFFASKVLPTDPEFLKSVGL